jgi:hypothetical protein
MARSPRRPPPEYVAEGAGWDVLEGEARELLVPVEDAVQAGDVRVVRRRGGHAEVRLGLVERGVVAAQRLDREHRARGAVARLVDRAARTVAEDGHPIELGEAVDDWPTRRAGRRGRQATKRVLLVRERRRRGQRRHGELEPPALSQPRRPHRHCRCQGQSLLRSVVDGRRAAVAVKNRRTL